MVTAWLIVLLLGYQGAAGAKPQVEAAVTRPMRLREAYYLGLENSPVVRMIKRGGDQGRSGELEIEVDDPISITTRDGKDTEGGLASDLMAFIRAIDQQYWAIWMQQVQLSAHELGEKVADEVVADEEKRLASGSGHAEDVAGARKAFQKYRDLRLADRADMNTLQRQFRNMIGLPMDGCPWVVASTSPAEEWADHDRAEGLMAMIRNEPELLRQRGLVESSGRKVGLAKAEIYVLSLVPVAADLLDPVLDLAQLQTEAGRQQTAYRRLLKQKTEALDRMAFNVTSNYQQFWHDQPARTSAWAHLDAARSKHARGKPGGTAESVVAALDSYTNALIQEATARAYYNTSLSALAECRGTILRDRHLLVVAPSKDQSRRRD